MKNQSEETQLVERSDPKRAAKPVPLIKQNIILQHKLNKAGLKSDAEKFAYEAGRAAAEIFVQPKCDAHGAGDNENAAEDVLNAIYESMEEGIINLAQANQIVLELKKPLAKQNERLRKRLKEPGLPK